MTTDAIDVTWTQEDKDDYRAVIKVDGARVYAGRAHLHVWKRSPGMVRRGNAQWGASAVVDYRDSRDNVRSVPSVLGEGQTYAEACAAAVAIARSQDWDAYVARYVAEQAEDAREDSDAN